MILFGLLLSLTTLSHAEDVQSKRCFDFATKVVSPLREAPKTFDAKKDPGSFQDGEKTDSASISGVVQKPILELYQKLTDPSTIRNDDNTEIKVTETQSKNYLKLITQSIKMTPVFFLTLRWDEQWAFAVKDGTDTAPKTVVISYEKLNGTSHIQHLCGNIVLQSLSPSSTGVFIYEEMKADRREAKDILKSMTGTLRTLRGIPAETSKES